MLKTFAKSWEPQRPAGFFSRNRKKAADEARACTSTAGSASARPTSSRRSGTRRPAPSTSAPSSSTPRWSAPSATRAPSSCCAGPTLICIDEFELDDPGDTMMMTRMLGELVASGTRIAATSNTPPNALGEGRFAASDFLREIQSLSEHFETVRIDGLDYRRRDTEGRAVTVEPDEYDRIVAALAVARRDGHERRLRRPHRPPGHRAPVAVHQDARRRRRDRPHRRARAPRPDGRTAARRVHRPGVRRRDPRSSRPATPLSEVFDDEMLGGGYRKKYLRSVSRMIALTDGRAAAARRLTRCISRPTAVPGTPRASRNTVFTCIPACVTPAKHAHAVRPKPLAAKLGHTPKRAHPRLRHRASCATTREVDHSYVASHSSGLRTQATVNALWLLVAAALVLLMTPGVAFFYGGMVRAKSVISMMMMSFGAMAIVGVLWVLYGYGLSFGTPLIPHVLGTPDWVPLQPDGQGRHHPRPGRPRVRRIPGDLRHHHRRADLRCDRRPRQVRRLDGLRRHLGDRRLLPGRLLGLQPLAGLDRLDPPRERLRGWHRGPHQRRCRGPRPGPGARQARRIPEGHERSRTTFRSRSSARPCCGSAGSASTPAPRPPSTVSRRSPGSTRSPLPPPRPSAG